MADPVRAVHSVRTPLSRAFRRPRSARTRPCGAGSAGVMAPPVNLATARSAPELFPARAVSCTTASTRGRRVGSPHRVSGTTYDDPGELGRWFAAAPAPVRWSATWRRSRAPSGCRGGAAPGRGRVRRGPGRGRGRPRRSPLSTGVVRQERSWTLGGIVQSVQEGFREGERHAETNGKRIRIGTLLCAMRRNAGRRKSPSSRCGAAMPRFRHRGSGSRLSAHSRPGRIRMRAAAARAIHDSRR